MDRRRRDLIDQRVCFLAADIADWLNTRLVDNDIDRTGASLGVERTVDRFGARSARCRAGGSGAAVGFEVWIATTTRFVAVDFELAEAESADAALAP